MKQVFLNRLSGNVSTTVVNYHIPTIGSPGEWDGSAPGWGATENQRQIVIPAAGTIRNLKVTLNGAPGTAASGKSYAFTLRLNTADTTLTTTITDTAVTNKDTTHSFTVAAGDILTISCTPTGTPTARAVDWSFEFEGTTAAQNIYCGNGQYNGTGTTKDFSLVGAFANSDFNTLYMHFAHACTIRAFYIAADTGPGAAKTATFKLSKNESDQASSSVSLTGAGTGAGVNTTSVTGLSIAIVAGDRIKVHLSSFTASTGIMRVGMGVLVESTTDGESTLMMGNRITQFNTTSTYYMQPMGVTAFTQITTEANAQATAGITGFDLKKMYVQCGTAPGIAASGKKRDIFLRKAAANTALTVQILETATTGSDAVNTVSIVEGDLINTSIVPTSTPAASLIGVSMVQYIAPVSTFIAQRNFPILQAINRAATY